MPGELSDHLCECGCGEYTGYAQQSCTRHGYVRGKPQRFARGHRFIPSRKRFWKTVPGHPAATARDQLVPLHRLALEAKLGRYLSPNEMLYPVLGYRVLARRGYNNLLRYRMRAKAACGDPNAVQCFVCKQWGRDVERRSRAGCGGFTHAACWNLYCYEYKTGLRGSARWTGARAALARARRALRAINYGHPLPPDLMMEVSAPRLGMVP